MNTRAETTLRDLVHTQQTPSVQYVMFSQNNIIHHFQAGYADIKHKTEVSDKTTYHGFSVTKTFTALAVLQLAQQNLINIHDPIKIYLPDFPYSSAITIKQILTHSAGIPNPIPLNWIHLASEHTSFNSNSFFAKMLAKHHQTISPPNEKYTYSNLGYVILGQLIEKITGLPYEQFITDNILKTIGLDSNDLGFLIPNSDRHAKGYHKYLSISNVILGFLINKNKFMDKKEGEWKPFKDFYINGSSYGGLIGTAAAFVRYIQELLKPACTLINDEYKKLLFTENHTNAGDATGMCLSWFSGELNGQKYFTHAGGGGGYYCEIRIYPELSLGSVIMLNRTGMKDERLLNKIDTYHIN